MAVKVLVVDDSLVARLAVRAALAPEGVELREAGSGEAALEAVEGGFLPEVVFLDLTMPGIDGLGTLARLRERTAHPKVIVLTADLNPGTVEAVRAAGAFDIIRKPADAGLVRGALERALRGEAPR